MPSINIAYSAIPIANLIIYFCFCKNRSDWLFFLRSDKEKMLGTLLEKRCPTKCDFWLLYDIWIADLLRKFDNYTCCNPCRLRVEGSEAYVCLLEVDIDNRLWTGEFSILKHLADSHVANCFVWAASDTEDAGDRRFTLCVTDDFEVVLIQDHLCLV